MLLKPTKTAIILFIGSLLLYWVFAYELERTQYLLLVTIYALLFLGFYKILNTYRNQTGLLTLLAFCFRAVFLLAIPNLSQDFYRFIWDGRLVLQGINPYLHTVESFIVNNQLPVPQSLELYKGMGALNASHFTNYPPINQLCFVIAAFLSNTNIMGSVVVMRLIIILADFGTLFFGKKLLGHLNLPEHHIYWYMLNPLIIIELTGNLHFEGIMIFFLIWSLYLLFQRKRLLAAVVLALSISTKLIPLIFLPLFFQFFVGKRLFFDEKTTTSSNLDIEIQQNQSGTWKSIKRLVNFYTIVIGTVLLFFLPFYSKEFVSNYTKTVALWFQNFEFNASIYYIARAIGYTFRGYNEIAIIGKYSAILVITYTLAIAFFRKNKSAKQLVTAMLLILSFYYFTATTVHPWYIATLLALSIFTRYKFPLVWSSVIILSYLAYLNVNSMDKSENLLIITLEYTIVYSAVIWELFIKKAPERGVTSNFS